MRGSSDDADRLAHELLNYRPSQSKRQIFTLTSVKAKFARVLPVDLRSVKEDPGDRLGPPQKGRLHVNLRFGFKRRQ
jgi:hypothetical protein